MLSVTKPNCEFSFLLNEEKFHSRTTHALLFSARVQWLIADFNECRDDASEIVMFPRGLEWEGGQRRRVAHQREACGCMSKFSLVLLEADEVFYCTAQSLPKHSEREANLALLHFVVSKSKKNLPGFTSG